MWIPEIYTFFLCLTKKKKKSALQLFVGGRGCGGGIILYWQGFGFIVYALFKITTYAVYHL